ncbi:hypothetical protein ACIO1C_02520 [Streptomyces sp. NPDC087420]|uniref:hypothetical protein n=1 Tax=Streptomyces sp. NPDC087420 TaxID=3365785 RepID=UPI003836E585
MRAAVFTLISVVLAAVGHHLASEEPVPWSRLAVIAVVMGAVSAAGTGRARSWWAVTTATCGAQLVLHSALSAPAAPAHDHARAHTAASLGYEAHHGPTVMTLAHGTAAVAVALLMYRADRALSGLPRTVGRWARTGIALVAAALGRWAIPVCAVPSVRRDPREAEVRPAAETMLSHVVERRGPPPGRAGNVLSLTLAGRPYAGRVRPY